ncbi:MAG TPA: translation initiation factor [Verrucomicrobiae bacterium]|jgi:translation initiation factor 1|nr:translation initiation factor [Verrucomicrobiae bacterium]
MARKERYESQPEMPPELNNPFADLSVDNLPLGEDPAPKPARATASFGRVVLRRETAHRGGRVVVVIYDFAPSISRQSIEDLARRLRQACGCGGTARERTIEIQGDQVTKLRDLLEKEGFKVAGVK